MPQAAEDSTYERYELREPAAVVGLLQRLIERRCMVTVVPAVSEPEAAPRPGVISALLAVNAGQLWVGVPREASVLDGLLHQPRLAFDGYLERVHVRFRTGPARLDSHDGHPALRLPVPDRIVHLQRRELMRREPPPGALRCTLPASADSHTPVRATIRDIGGGGLAVLVPESALRLQVGEVLRQCRLEIPDAGPLEVDLEICHVREISTGSVQQAGCRFVDLPATAQSRLLRYLMQLDRESVARG